MAESISEKNLNSLIKKLKTMQATLSPVVLEKNATGLKALLVETFQMCCKFSSLENEDEMLSCHTEIKNYISKIEKETSLPIIIPFLKGVDRKHRLKNLFDWIKSQQVDLSNVEIFEKFEKIENQDFKDNSISNISNLNNSKSIGYGLKLLKEMKQGDIVFKIPKNLILTCEIFLNNHEMSNIVKNDPLLNSMPNILLSFGLVFEFYKRNDSNWRIYLESLPHTFYNICSFETADFVLLKGSRLFKEALYLWTSCIRQYLYLHLKFIDAINSKNNNELKEFIKKYNLHSKFNLKDYLWAVSVVMTRVNPIPILNKERQNTLGLIPIMDLCNHIETVYSIDFDQNCCSVLSPSDLKVDDELRIFYGARPTSLLLIYNGFYLENNPNNFVIFKISQNVDIDLYNLRKGLLNTMKLLDSDSHPISLSTNIWDGELKIIFRILFCKDTEYQSLMKMGHEQLVDKLNSNNGISYESEILALTTLKQKLYELLNSYPPPFSILPNENNYIRKSCALFVEQEKSVFTKAIQDIEDIIVNIKTLEH